MKRIKTYDSVKIGSKFSFEDLDYNAEFILKESNDPSRTILGKRRRKEQEAPHLNPDVKDFTDTLKARFEENMEIEDNLIETIKDSQLDYILKFNKKVNKSIQTQSKKK